MIFTCCKSGAQTILTYAFEQIDLCKLANARWPCKLTRMNLQVQFDLCKFANAG